MCGLWGTHRNEYEPGQDGGFAAWGSLWPPQVAKQEAKACVEGLENMFSHLVSQCAVSRQAPLGASHPHAADCALNVMRAWCHSVSRGRMPHGQLLAHAKMKGDENLTHPSGEHLVPKERYNVWSEYPWGSHGEDGVSLVRKFLVQCNFGPGPSDL